MNPGDLIQVLRPPKGFAGRKGMIIKIIGDDDRYSKVRIMWHPWGDHEAAIEMHAASWVASHCTILCKAQRG